MSSVVKTSVFNAQEIDYETVRVWHPSLLRTQGPTKTKLLRDQEMICGGEPFSARFGTLVVAFVFKMNKPKIGEMD